MGEDRVRALQTALHEKTLELDTAAKMHACAQESLLDEAQERYASELRSQLDEHDIQTTSALAVLRRESWMLRQRGRQVARVVVERRLLLELCAPFGAWARAWRDSHNERAISKAVAA